MELRKIEIFLVLAKEPHFGCTCRSPCAGCVPTTSTCCGPTRGGPADIHPRGRRDRGRERWTPARVALASLDEISRLELGFPSGFRRDERITEIVYGDRRRDVDDRRPTVNDAD